MEKEIHEQPEGFRETIGDRVRHGTLVLDGLGMGLGFAFALSCLGTIREVLGAGTFLGFHLFGPNFEPWVLFLLPPGGFISLAVWLLTFTLWRERQAKQKQLAAESEIAQAVGAGS